ncbi:MAG TPA: TolC family protein [Segetibacter sp.]
MKNIFALFLSITIMYTSASAQGVDSNRLTLKQCIDIALKNNAQVQQTGLQLQTAAANYKQAKENVLPDVFGNVAHGINQGRSIDPFTNSYINQGVSFANYNVSSGIVLFNGYQLKNLIQQTSLTYEANKMDVQQVKDNITLNVILAYLQILNNQDQIVQSRAQADVTRKQVERLNVMNEAGAIIPAQLYDLRGQLANDELAIINNQNALNTARLTLSQLMNVPYNRNLEVQPLSVAEFSLLYEGNPTAMYGLSEKTLSLVKAADLRRQSAEKGVQAARSGFYPTVSLSGSLSTNFSSVAQTQIPGNTVEVASGDFVTIGTSKVPVMTQRTNFSSEKIGYFNQFTNNYNTSVYLNVRVPIFNAYRTRNRVTLAKIEQRTAEVASQNIRTQLGQDIEQAYFSMTGALDRYKTLERQVRDFEESFRTAEVRFNAGALTQIDYLIAKNNVDRAKNNLIIARYDYLFRTKILDYYQGRLVVE